MLTRLSRLAVLVSLVAVLLPAGLAAQDRGTGTLTGTVTRASDSSRLAGVSVTIKGMSTSTVTGTNGQFTIQRVPEGPQTLVFRWLGYKPLEAQAQVTTGSTQRVDVALEAQPITLGEVVVSTASRAPERAVEAPAAVSAVEPAVTRAFSVTGQAPLALATVPGVDLVQSGVNDFNLNARGFNSSLNRRVLVMQDSRDLSIAFLGAQEWNGLALPLEDMGPIEVVRGPGSALYGANAFAGVVNISTPTAREVAGTKATLAGGELSSLRADVRHAGVVSGGRLGYRLNVGSNRSDTWTRSRTARDTSDFQAEYAEGTEGPITPVPQEVRPLNGQDTVPTTRAASGERDDLVNTYGTARIDYYADNGAVGTVEGGVAQVENEVFVTGIGRVQVSKTLKPWSRVAWAAPRYNVMAWYTGRDTKDPQYSLASGLGLEEHSSIFHVEAQYNGGLAGDAGRFVVGASLREYQLDTKGTLMAPADDGRSDSYYSAYGQVEYKFTPALRAVVAARFDDGDLFDGQVSPKAALVYSPNARHSVRVTVNRAFQTPNYSEFFLRVPAGTPTASPRTLETGLEGYFATIRANFGADPTLPATPTDLPWNFNPLTQPLALGNANLNPEHVTGWELGYKGNLTSKLYASLDLYHNRLTDFVTDLLPGVNPDYPVYLLTDGGTDIPQTLTDVDAYLASRGLPPTHPLRAAIPQLRGGYNQLNAALVSTSLLATLPNGQRAIVVSYANAGKVNEQGVELSAGYLLTDEVRVEGSYTFFDFDPPTGALVGDKLLPNTPKHKGTLSVQYAGAQGLDLGVTLRRQTAFDWATGVFNGFVDWSQTVNMNAGYQVNNNLRVHAIATNVLDQKRFHLYGGSVIGRRVIGGVTATF
ncbi:MAG TPA: TonB-dependent receptor [Gemmatimonadales bacterium]|nr:TonB-dependent receptor [Gemmatimonadales bacterium]